MSDNKQDDADTLSALMAAAKQKVDTLSATAQTKYNEASAEAANMVNAAKESFNQGMQKADQLADSAKAKFNEGMEAAQQLASDTKAKFEAGVKSAQDMAADAKQRLQQGLADAKQQGDVMMDSAKKAVAEKVESVKDRVRNPGESDKEAMLEVGKHAAEVATEAMGQGAHAMAGAPGAREVVQAVQHFQDAGGMPVAKMIVEQKFEDAGLRSTNATVAKMVDQSNAEQSKFLPDNDFNRLQKAVEQDAKLGKGPEDSKPPEPAKTVDDSKFVNPKGPQDSKFLSDDLKAKYLARAQDIGQDANKASAHWDSSNPKPPQTQPDKPAVNANPNPSTQSQSPAPAASAPKPPSPTPSPKP